MWGESQQDGNPSRPPPPTKWRVYSGGSPMWGPAKMTCHDPPTPVTTRHDPPRPATYHMTGWGRKTGATTHFSKCSLIKDYFKKFISHNRSAKLAPSLLQCQSSPISFLQAVRRENVSYIVTRAYKRHAETACLSESATLHSTGNISAEVSENKNKAGHNSTHGTVSSLLFFTLKLLLHPVYIFNIFMWTEVKSSRRLKQKKPYR